MFEQVPADLLQRAMRPPVRYGRHILAETLQSMQELREAESYIILTQPEAWEAAREQFRNVDSNRVIYLRSMEYAQLMAMELALPPAVLVMGIGGGQAMDAAKYVAWQRKLPLILAPTIVSVDAAVTNTIAVREGQRVRYTGFVVADAPPQTVDAVVGVSRGRAWSGVHGRRAPLSVQAGVRGRLPGPSMSSMSSGVVIS